MSWPRCNPRYLATFCGILTIFIPCLVLADPTKSGRRSHRVEPPEKLPLCALPAEKKWQPSMDFDAYSCYNVPALGWDGTLSHGLPPHNKEETKGCRNEDDLYNNNVYVHSRCNDGWCAYLYDYYFEKDVRQTAYGGYRHDWEHAVVWVQEGQGAQYVAVSTTEGYNVSTAKDVKWDGETHAKIIYYKDENRTHALRFAAADEAIQNVWGEWFRGDLVSYFGFPTVKLREKLMRHKWGKARPDFVDEYFPDALLAAKGGLNITMDNQFDDRLPKEMVTEPCVMLSGDDSHKGRKKKHH